MSVLIADDISTKYFLVADSDSEARQHLCALLQEAFANAEIDEACSIAQAEQMLGQAPYDFLICDFIAPSEANPLHVLHSFLSAAPNVPIVIATSHNDSALAMRAIQEGAQDYLIKGLGSALTLRRIVEHSLERTRIRSELEHAKNSLESMVEERTRELANALAMLDSASRAKEEFFANMTHELRTPLHAIINFSRFGMKKANTAPAETLADFFSDIHLSGTRLLGLVNDLLDFTKLKSGKESLDLELVDSFDLVYAVSRELQPLLAQKSITLQLPEASECPKLRMDARRMHQVLVNLIGNACKFSPEGSQINLLVQDASSGDYGHRLTAASAPNMTIISVIDQGIGIPDAELTTVFDAFVQSSKVKSGTFYGGTGLGLAICKQIIQAHDGVIWAEANPNGGAIIRFMLPSAA